MVKKEGFEHRVLIEPTNPSIMCNDDLCKKCKLCQKACQNDVGVFGFYDLEKTGNQAICINCGACIQACPFNAIKAVSNIDLVKSFLADKSKVVVFNTAPAVRVSLGEEFGMERGSFVEGKMVSAIRKLGANYVLDVTCGADLTIMEEASELIEKLKNKDKNHFPMFTSCCPAWVKMCEMYYPEFIDNLSTAKSPISMQGAIVKSYFAEQIGVDKNDIINVTVAPCVAKKAEILREELSTSGGQDVDIVITTVELANLIKENNIDFVNLEDSDFDSIFGHGSSSGLIFGNTGGVMQAALRSAYFFMTGKNMTEDELRLCEPIRGIENLKMLKLDINGRTLNVAAVSQMSEAKKLIEMIKNKEVDLDFVEVMACKGGCANGGGQSKVIKRPEMEPTRVNRNKGLYSTDNSNSKLRFCHDNPEIKKLYETYLDYPLSDKSHHLLHTHYFDKSYMLDRGSSNEKN